MDNIKFEYINSFDKFEIKRIHRFLIKISDDFVPPLKQKVDLKEYTLKLLNNAIIQTAVEKEKIVGLIAFYCNNLDTKIAYISIIGVNKNYRGRGIGNKLLKNAINYIRSNGFREIELETWENSSAQNLYIKNGFGIDSFANDRPNGIRSVKMKLKI